jgi:epoxyqueuosine reductase
LKLTAAAFDRQYGKTPLARPGRAGVLRNACIVLGNTGDRGALPSLIAALGDEEPLVRGGAAWGVGRIGGPDARVALESRALVEDNPDVTREIQNALGQLLQAEGSIDG